MTPHQATRLKAAEAWLAFACAATRGLYIGNLFLKGSGHEKPDALPDALYVTRFNPYEATLLYDVQRCRYQTVPWPDWFEARDGVW